MDKDLEKLLDSLMQADIKWKKTPKDSICMKEIVELFVNDTIYSIKNQEEIPNFNILFPKEAFKYIQEIKQNTYQYKSNYRPNIYETSFFSLIKQNQFNSSYLTLVVKDYKLFFELFTDIVNEQLNLNYDYGYNDNARALALRVMKRIWLRLGVDDLENIELFLKKQLDFLKNREFDSPKKEIYLKNHQENRIIYEIEKCETWCETTRRIHFKIYESESKNYHDLPKIYYDIREENFEKVCYIYAVQTGKDRHRINSIERKLYKLTKNIDDINISPNFIMAMNLFYEILYTHNITHIKVPVLQVLSYDYHIILSKNTKDSFEKNWTKYQLNYLQFLENSRNQREYNDLKEIYQQDKEWYNHVVDKEDFISKRKTEGLINLFEYMTYLDDRSKINTIPFTDSPYLDISLIKENFVNDYREHKYPKTLKK